MPKTSTEHPAARAAREINDRLPASVLNQGIVEEVGASEAALQYKCELVAIIRRAYAERDARVLKALEAAAEFSDIYSGSARARMIGAKVRAAIAELKGEGQ